VCGEASVDHVIKLVLLHAILGRGKHHKRSWKVLENNLRCCVRTLRKSVCSEHLGILRNKQTT